MHLLRKLTQHVLRFFLPWACAGCRTALGTLDDTGFCGLCWLAIRRIDGFVCQQCGLPIRDGGNTCYGCREAPAKILIRGATVYDAKMRSAIHRLKYAGRKSLVDPLSILLTNAWARFPELHDAQVLVPVPLHRSTLKIRGYNQSAMLSERLSDDLGIPMAKEILYRHRSTRPQFELKKSERWMNVDDAFSVTGSASILGKRILIIDDVCTTGATVVECARVLRSAGSGRVSALVLARDL